MSQLQTSPLRRPSEPASPHLTSPGAGHQPLASPCEGSVSGALSALLADDCLLVRRQRASLLDWLLMWRTLELRLGEAGGGWGDDDLKLDDEDDIGDKFKLYRR